MVIEQYYKLTAPEYKDMLVKRTNKGESYIYTLNGWVDFDTIEFFGDDSLFKDEYELVDEKDIKKLIILYENQIKSFLIKVENLAKRYHEGQTDKGNNPYMNHIYSVVDGVNLPEEKIIAYLHDTLEDTEMTVSKMKQHRIPEWIIVHVELLTHKKEEDYFDYVNRLKYFPFAKNIKVADLKNNLDISRLKKITGEDKERLKKYRKALKILEEN